MNSNGFSFSFFRCKIVPVQLRGATVLGEASASPRRASGRLQYGAQVGVHAARSLQGSYGVCSLVDTLLVVLFACCFSVIVAPALRRGAHLRAHTNSSNVSSFVCSVLHRRSNGYTVFC